MTGCTPNLYRSPESLAEDIHKLREMTEAFQAGTLPEARYRAARVPMGIYEQREGGKYMLRVRLPAGGVLPHQMRALAGVSQQFGDGVLHVTTRQDIQVHRVGLDAIHPALLALCEAGLSTKGGGGNTVRNITACPDSGVCPNEAFDVTPYVVAVTEFLLPDPLSYELPRKYKIAFSGCSRDCAGATVHDLGFVARIRAGAPGFAVYAGGGLGARSRVADLLEEFVPASECHLVAEAVKRVFDRHGNRKERNRARLRFLVDQIGLAAFRELYQEQLESLRREAPPLGEADARGAGFQPADGSSEVSGPPDSADEFRRWRERNTRPQKQEGYFTVGLPLSLGDIGADVLRALAEVVEVCGEGLARATQSQNLALRWVHESQLPEVHARLARLGLAEAPPRLLHDLVTCTGASTCKLGICLSRGMAQALAAALSRSDLDLDRLGELKVHVSGCPNSCGRHQVGQIGFSGAMRRVGRRVVPHYAVWLGGHVEEGQTRLAASHGTVPARNVPRFLEELLRAFAESPQCPDFGAFLQASGRQIADDLIAQYRAVPDFEEDSSFYFDWGAEQVCSLAGRGPGECGAGVFDLIRVDLDSATEALQAGRHYAAVVLAARALLVTRGEQPETEADALRLFRRHFLETNLVSRELDGVIASALSCASQPAPEQAFEGSADDSAALIQAVRDLYGNMDSSLRTPQPSEAKGAGAARDFRGLSCPLSFVRTKLALEELAEGQVLEVLLNEESAQNVPASAAAEGHGVVSVKQEEDHWRVSLRKAAAGRA